MTSSDALRFVNSNSHQLLTSQSTDAQSAHQEQRVTQSIDLTVAIPTYNGSQRLPAVLDRLKAQTGTDSLSWEIIVADNNSKDDTAAIIKQYQLQWPQATPLRYTFVGEQGAAFARQRAVEIAQGNIIAFLDDDNVPETDWIANVHHFALAHPDAGAFGSQIHGDFESPLPKELKSFSCFLAVVERGSKPCLYDPQKKMLPPGAGLAVRRSVWLKHVPKRLFLNHKGKKAGLASEDLEAVLHIQKAGWEVWYNPDMVVYHRIPSARLQESYLRSLLRCVGLSRFYVRMLGTTEWKRPFVIPAYIANDLRKLALHVIRNRNRSHSLKTNCEREYLTSTLQSPFFIARKALQDTYQAALMGNEDEKQSIMRLIETGFETEQFQLYRQPVFECSKVEGSLLHAEVLIRLNAHLPSNDLWLPQKFMPVAETYGLSQTIDRWVLRRLMASFQNSQAANGEGQPVGFASYSINLSAATVCDTKFVEFLADLLGRYNVSPKQLCFEVSETVVTNHLQAAISLSNELKSLGCQFVLDDFRNGQLLPYFSNGALDCIKINFLAKGISHNPEQLKRFKAKLQKQMSMPVKLVAKGIENNEIQTLATTAGIPFMQGYQLGKPIPFEMSDHGPKTS